MSLDIVMPRLSDSMEEGTILTWIKSVGDQVALGEELVEIETDKANMVFEADAAGTLIEIVAPEGETLPIGEVIARVGEPPEAGPDGGANRRAAAGDQGPPAAPPRSIGRQPEAPVATAEAGEPPAHADAEAAGLTAPTTGDARVKASPLARRLAAEHGLELAAISGSGPAGRVVKADVEAVIASGSASTDRTLRSSLSEQPSASSPAQAGSRSSSLDSEEHPPLAPIPASAPAGLLLGGDAASSAKGRVEIVEPTKLQQTVARRMAESKATAPHFYLRTEVDMSAAVAARSRLKAAAAEGDVIPSLNDLVVKACAIALTEHPRANGAYRDGRFELYERVNVGIAVAAQEALVVPTIFDADRKGLAQIASEARALAVKVREGAITPPELSGGTFTISNLGMYGMGSIGPVLSPPQAAILGVGEIAERPVVRDGGITTAMLMGATLACDHRILYGADGAEFLAKVRALLEEPLGLAL